MLNLTDTEKEALINKLSKILKFVNYGAGVDAYFGNGSNANDDFELLLDPDEPDNEALCSVLEKLQGTRQPQPALTHIVVPTEFVKGLYKTLLTLEAMMCEKDLGHLEYKVVEQQVSSLSVGLQNEGVDLS